MVGFLAADYGVHLCDRHGRGDPTMLPGQWAQWVAALLAELLENER